MARKHKHPEHVNHERWLVSYADFVTLLFAFFVVLFATSQTDTNKLGRFTESFSKAVGAEFFPNPGQGLLPGDVLPTGAPEEGPHGPMPEELRGLGIALEDGKTTGVAPTDLEVVSRRNELVVRLPDGMLFASGDDAIDDASRQKLEKLAALLAARNVQVRVEGHTDDIPISSGRFRSNWELSAARSMAVVRLLSKSGIAKDRLSGAGYGEFRPVSPNDGDTNRRKNRRVDLVVSVAQDDVDGGRKAGQ
jgi:chemotaxis protein MotB